MGGASGLLNLLVPNSRSQLRAELISEVRSEMEMSNFEKTLSRAAFAEELLSEEEVLLMHEIFKHS